jgi:NTP pyrophosphatase (non-canonical NTP hydrolase)
MNIKNKLLEYSNDAVIVFGKDHQLLKVIEELNELSSVLSKYLLKKNKVKVEDIKLEMVDVYIMLFHLQNIFGEFTEDELKLKIYKLAQAIDNEKFPLK